jgi:hypothetical protein
MILFLLVVTIAFLVVNMYYYLLPYWETEYNLYATKFQSDAQKAVITPVVVEMLEDNEWDDDPPTVVATPKNRSNLKV